MNSSISQTNDSFSNIEILHGELISLDQKDYDQAIQISESTDSGYPWQIYLRQLAISAISQWCQEWVEDLPITPNSVSLEPSQLDLGPENIGFIQVGQFQCCLLVSESFIDGNVIIPKKLVDSPHFATHFYIVVEIWEMQQQASIRGFLPFREFQKAFEKSSSVGELVQIPLAVFERSSLYLLKELRLRSVRELEVAQPTPTNLPKISPIINVALWLQDTLENISHSPDWGIPAPLTPLSAAGWRSTEPFDAAITTLMDQGMAIPPHARGSCQSIMLNDIPIRILAAVWSLPSSPNLSKEDWSLSQFPDKKDEWSLLVILGTETGDYLPLGIELQVRDQTQILTEQTLEQDDAFLIAQVIGGIDDQFDVAVALGQQLKTLSSFVYTPI